MEYGKQEEELILQGKDRTQIEQAFHQAITVAAHNSFVERLMPMIYQAIDSGVLLSNQADSKGIIQDTVNDHRLIIGIYCSKEWPWGKKQRWNSIFSVQLKDLDFQRINNEIIYSLSTKIADKIKGEKSTYSMKITVLKGIITNYHFNFCRPQS